MNRFFSVLSLLWAAICMAFFLGLILVAAFHAQGDTLTGQNALMVITMLLSSLAFYFIGYKSLFSKWLIKLLAVCFAVNFIYIMFYDIGGTSIYDVNIIAILMLSLLFFFRYIKQENIDLTK